MLKTEARILGFLLGFVLMLAWGSCGSSKDQSLSAVLIPGPPGLKCVAILAGQEAIGGNCVSQ
jgi:hypothetical protein